MKKKPKCPNLMQREKCAKRREWLVNIKSEKGCMLCLEKHPACITFHHRDPKEKSFELSRGIEKYSMEKIQAEMDKCDMLCFNCHAKVHFDIKNSKNTTENVH